MSNYFIPTFFRTYTTSTNLNPDDAVQCSAYAAIAFDGALLIAVPRPTSFFGGHGSWLQLQCNPLTLENGHPTPLIEAVSAGNYYPLTEIPPYYFNESPPPNIGFRPRIDLIAGAQPVVIWAEWQPNYPVSFRYYFPTVQDGNLQPVNLNDVQNLEAMDFFSTFNLNELNEFAVACVNTQVFTFWYHAFDLNFYLCILDYVNPLQLCVNNQPVALWQTLEGNTLLSFDVAVVYQGSTTDFTGITTPNIAIATLSQTENGPLIDVKIMKVADQSFTELCSFAPPCACPPGSTIRVTWGSLPGADPQASNGLCVLVTPNTPDGPIGNNPWIAVVDISPPPNYGTIGGWTSLMPPLSIYTNSNDFAIGVNCASTVLFPIIDNATDQSQNALYNVGFLGTACLNAPGEGSFVQIFTAPMPAFNMNYVAGNANPSNQLAEANTADITTAISAWQLLGIVAGLPPYPADATDPTASVEILYSTSNSENNTVTSGSSLTAGGTLSICNTSVSVASSMASKSSVTVNLAHSQTFSTHTVITPDTGWMLFYQPQYCVDQFQVNTRSSTPSGVVFQMLMQSNTAGGYAAYPFNITNPNEAINPNDPISQCLAQFPEFKGWPSTTDPNAWFGYYDKGSWALTETSPAMTLSAITPGQSVGESSLTCASSQATELNSSQTIEASADCTIMKDVLGFQISGSVTTSLSSTVSANSTFSITVKYGNIGDTVLTLQPRFFQASSPAAPWVPTVVSSQQPWVLMWDVSSD